MIPRFSEIAGPSSKDEELLNRKSLSLGAKMTFSWDPDDRIGVALRTTERKVVYPLQHSFQVMLQYLSCKI